MHCRLTMHLPDCWQHSFVTSSMPSLCLLSCAPHAAGVDRSSWLILQLACHAGCPWPTMAGICAGILVLRHGDATSAAMSAWAKRLTTHSKENESAAFEALAMPQPAGRKAQKETNHAGLPAERFFRGFGGSVSVGILAATGFANGHTYFVQRLFQVRHWCMTAAGTRTA